MSESQIPVARREGLVIQELRDEVLVYDLETNKAHCLNKTAASIWKFCDGKNSVADISRILADTTGSLVQKDLIWLAIDQLNENNLLENAISISFNNQTRREVIKKVGFAAVVALPVVTSLIAPKAAQAGSVCGTTVVCGSNSECPTACPTCSGGDGTPGSGTGICQQI